MNISRVIAYLIAGTSLTAWAQAPVTPSPPLLEVPTLYRSAFANYRPYVDAEPISWRNANDAAAAIGGPMGQMAKDVVPSAAAKPGAATAAPAKAEAGAPGSLRKSK